MDATTGKIISLEGNTESISVQLSLLPPSQKILVLPPLSQIATADVGDNFDARKFVRDIQILFSEQIQTAKDFLKSSTGAHRRLVFMNRGSISARATCIEKISKHVTNGDFEAAEAFFNELVKDGVSGLMRENEENEDDDAKTRNITDEPAAGIDGADVERPTSDITNTDLLDIKQDHIPTGNTVRSESQPLTKESEISVKSFLVQGSENDPGQRPASPHDPAKEPAKIPTSVFTTREGDHIVHTVLEVPIRPRHLPLYDPKVVHEKRSTFGPRDSSHTPSTQYHNAFSHQSEESEGDEEGLDSSEMVSPVEDILSTPATPAVVFGEACLVDVQSASQEKSLKKAQSFDRFSWNSSTTSGSFLAPPQLKHAASAYSLRKRNSETGAFRQKRYSKFPTTPRSTFVKASQTTIKRSPTLNGSMRTDSNSSDGQPPLPNLSPNVELSTEPEESADVKVFIFEPVLPVMEDIIIHLIDDNPKLAIEFVIQSFRSGKYCNYRSPSFISIPDSPTSKYSSPGPQGFDGKPTVRPSSYQAMVISDNNSEATYDSPMTYQSPRNFQSPVGNLRPSWPSERPIPHLDPPMPVRTPPSISSIADRISDLSPTTSPVNALSIHNSLRQFLSVHLPSSGGFSQHHYPVAPEAERLWKPVFGNDECSSIGDGGKTVDQIIAFGCEAGINREYFYQLSGQIERLGSKRDGLNRSGKLDIRYLIGTAMQSQSMLPVLNGVTENPFANANTLAALLVPQLEAFLAANPNTRLLILQYQANHLGIVLALQRILGTSIIKVAGILDSLASDPPSFSSMRAPASPQSIDSVAERWRERATQSKLRITNPDLDIRKSTDTKPVPQPIVVSFSRVNYLLTSTATDAETTNFLSGIWKCLMEKSAFYTPEVEVRPHKHPAMPPTPTSATRSVHEHPVRDSSRPPQMQWPPVSSKIARMTGANGSIAPSSSDSRSVRSARSIHTQRRSPSPIHTQRFSPPLPQPQQLHQRSTYRASSKPQRVHHESMSASTSPPVPKIPPLNTSERRVTLGADKSEKTWDNFYISEDDSDDDEMDRKVMGRELAHIVPEVRGEGVAVGMGMGMAPPPRNKKKALKWLGLA